MTVSEDTLLMILDRDPELIYNELQSKDCSLEALAVLTTYGTKLPAGKEYGDRDQRRQWLDSERAKRVRQNIAKLIVPQIKSPQDLQEFLLHVRQRRGVGRLINGIIEECQKNLMVKA